MTSGYSKYFSFEELTDSEEHKELVEQNRIDAMKFVNSGKRLSKLAESVREILGGVAIKANSGFRNEKLNKAVGSKQDGKEGRKLSNHCKFEAVDLNILNMAEKQAFDKLIQAKKDGLLPDLRKVLLEGSWLHIEVSMSVNDYKGFFISKDGNKTWERVA